MTQVIMLNGPRTVGKNYIADKFIEQATSARMLPIAWPMKLQAMAERNLTPSDVHVMEFAKDRKIARLGGLSPREAYIEFGTRMREQWGQDYFANLWSVHARNFTSYKIIVVPDARFQEEVNEACKEFGEHNVILVRVHRENFGWRDDIGSYLKHWIAIDFDNDAQSPDVGVLLHEKVRGLLL